MASSAPRVLYLDASAIVKLVVRERETDRLIAYVGDAALVSSEVSEVEVPRAAFLRTGESESIARAETALRRFSLVALDDELRREASRARPAELRSLDAIHLASCLRLRSQVDAVVVYNRRLTAALRAHALPVEAPGP
ncbi:MAG TPA: PIN domain-containing protein [Candidatus Limnocylindria bacterium]|nr:PIN domain-containing protein [Candidatus Limnocylindria bacterium]